MGSPLKEPDNHQSWSIIYQIGKDYRCHNNQQEIDRLEGVSMANAWASPNTPDEVLQLLHIRLAVKNGKLTIINR